MNQNNTILIMEDFVTFEIAKKLEEKGFDYPCMNAINSFRCTYRNGWCEYLDDREGEFITLKDLKEGDFLLPTISQVLKWLREEKKIYIEIYMYHNCYLWEAYSTEIYNADFTQKSEKYSETEYKSYELASLAGIKYVLENLI